MVNGAKAATRRDRQAKGGSKEAKSQLKSVRPCFKNPQTSSPVGVWMLLLFQLINIPRLHQNASAKTVKCKVCFQDFQSTVKKPELEKHVENKHSGKDFGDCFPEMN